MKHLLMFTPFFQPHVGGIENYIQEFCNAITTRPYAVTIVTSQIPVRGAPNESSSRSIQILRVPAVEIVSNYPVLSFWDIRFWRVINIILHNDTDIVISNTRFFITSLLALAVAAWIGKPLVHIEHGSSPPLLSSTFKTFLAHMYDYSFGRLVLRKSTVVVSISRAVQTFVTQFDSRPSPVIYRGLDTTRLNRIPSSIPSHMEKSDQLVVLTVSRLYRWKGIEYGIRAVAGLPHNIQKQICYCIVGTGEDMEHLRSLAGPPVLLLGELTHDETISVIKSSHIYLHTSLPGGGLSTALLEAMYCGLAVIATPNEGASEVVQHSLNGLIIKSASEADIKSALTNLIANDSLRQRLGTHARATIQSTISWEKSIDAWEKLLARI